MNAESEPSCQGPVVPHAVYRCNVDRIRRDFPSLYPRLKSMIRTGEMIVVEAM